MLKVLIIEDHALVREGLLLALRGLEPGTQTLGGSGRIGLHHYPVTQSR